uniref:Uncharacterized protein n=1 Tax=Anopheles culicifacies TaxID=139723 RepID=A0A182LYI6_9DIPT
MVGKYGATGGTLQVLVQSYRPARRALLTVRDDLTRYRAVPLNVCFSFGQQHQTPVGRENGGTVLFDCKIGDLKRTPTVDRRGHRHRYNRYPGRRNAMKEEKKSPTLS